MPLGEVSLLLIFCRRSKLFGDIGFAVPVRCSYNAAARRYRWRLPSRLGEWVRPRTGIGTSSRRTPFTTADDACMHKFILTTAVKSRRCLSWLAFCQPQKDGQSFRTNGPRSWKALSHGALNTSKCKKLTHYAGNSLVSTMRPETSF